MHHCPRCGAEYLASEYVPIWKKQTSLFRAKVEARTELNLLLKAARAPAPPATKKKAEEAFFMALLESTVCACASAEPMPPNCMRFVQLVRPDDGQTVLPFFSDRDQAEMSAVNKLSIASMSGRRLFELTRGATLTLNPNLDQVTLYPAEVDALLEGRSLGYFSQETLQHEEEVGACLPSVPTDALVLALRDMYAREPAARLSDRSCEVMGLSLIDPSNP